MRRSKQWLALLLGVLMLAEPLAVHGAQVNERMERAQAEELPAVEEEREEQPDEDTEKEEAVYRSYSLYASVQKDVLEPGETQVVEVQTDAPSKDLKFESLDPTVATVSQGGVITAKSGGTSGSATVGIKVSCINPKDSSDQVFDICYITVQNTISLDRSECTIYLGAKNKEKLKAKANPNAAIQWKSSKTSVATVGKDGTITPKKAGKTEITATANGVTAVCRVTVKQPFVKLPSKATVYLKNPAPLEMQVSPTAKVTWKSSNPKIAQVNQKGVVTGKRTGTVTITATAHGVTKKCKVTVKKPTITIRSSVASYGNSSSVTTIFKGSTLQLYANALPAVSVKWKSSNPKIAKVDRNGIVTGIGSGTVTITAAIPGAKASWRVKVVKNSCQLNFTSKTLMAGQKATLLASNVPTYSTPRFYISQNDGSIEIYSDQNRCEIKARGKGKAVITVSFSTYMNGVLVSFNQHCTVKVYDRGIHLQQFSIAKDTSKQLKLTNTGGEISKVTWSSSNSSVASVDSGGVVTGKKVGSAKITAAVTFTSGKKKNYTTKMKVSDPKLASATLVAAASTKKSVGLTGTNGYSSIQWKSKKSSIASVESDGKLVAKKQGSTVLTAKVDGKTLRCKVYVSDPKLSSDYFASAPGGSGRIALTGLSAKSQVSYRSSNEGVAAVDASGAFTVRNGGRALITVVADGKELQYLIECASQTALNACAEGKAIMDRSTYSQPLRMTEGYYDCSSLVFRAYGRNSRLIGGSSWAPTAADMAKHMANTGKVLYWGPAKIEDLRPGDLIFYGNNGNGRYLGIYHVSMYYGNGYRLEKPMFSYYPSSNIVMIARPVP